MNLTIREAIGLLESALSPAQNTISLTDEELSLIRSEVISGIQNRLKMACNPCLPLSLQDIYAGTAARLFESYKLLKGKLTLADLTPELEPQK
jgi:hypothetical protein